jgi:hypothetical protein
VKRAAPLLLVCLAAAARAQPQGGGADDHLLAGARFFQQERYPEALVEFRVAERTGAGGAATWYVAATLVKLHRAEDALAAFARAEAEAPGDRDALLDYYRALACYDARLYFCADRLLAGLGQQPGPRMAAQATKIRGELAPLLAAAPAKGTIDWYLARGAEAVQTDKPLLAAYYFDEAVRLGALRSDGYRWAEAAAALERTRAHRTAAAKPAEKRR